VAYPYCILYAYLRSESPRLGSITETQDVAATTRSRPQCQSHWTRPRAHRADLSPKPDLVLTWTAAQARAWDDGDFDADHGFAFDGVGRPAHQSRARGLIGVEAAAVRAPLYSRALYSSTKK
jgi:hypothetical protein